MSHLNMVTHAVRIRNSLYSSSLILEVTLYHVCIVVYLEISSEYPTITCCVVVGFGEPINFQPLVEYLFRGYSAPGEIISLY